MRAGIRSRPWAGIDVGTYSVKLLALQPGVAGGRAWLAESVLPRAEGAPDRIHDKDIVAKAIADCLAKAGLSPRSLHGVTLGVSGSDVIIKQIAMPLMDEAEIASALRFEARKHLPFDPSGMIIDFQVLGRFAASKRTDVLLAAVAADHVERELAPLRALGMDADIVDATPLALTNALSHQSDAEDEPYVLLDIGSSCSHITLSQKGEPYFTRRLDFGGRTLTRAIANELKIPLDEAEEWKLAAGSDEPGFRVDWSSRELAAMLGVIQRDLADEIRRSLAFYRTVGNLPEAFRLWISGGTARLPGLAAHISDVLGIPVMVFNPVQLLPGSTKRDDLPEMAPQFTQAFGLALRHT